MSSTVGDTDKKRVRVQKSTLVSKQQVLTILIKGSNSSDVSSREQVQTPFMIYNTERHICSEDLNNLDKDTMSVESKGSDKVASDDTSVLDNLYNMEQRAWNQRAQIASEVIILKRASILRQPCGLERKVKGI